MKKEGVFLKFNWKKLNEGDRTEISCFVRENQDYYLLHYQRLPEEKDVDEILFFVPEGKTLNDKEIFFLYKEEKCIAILDVLIGFPNEKVLYIAMFVVHHNERRKGYGKYIIRELEMKARVEGIKEFRACTIEKNRRGMDFWKREGFKELKRTDLFMDKNIEKVIVWNKYI